MQDAAAWARRLAYFTIAYNLIEGAVALGFGVAEESLALAGFGADSLIEVASACLVLWRLRAPSWRDAASVARERTAVRGIGALFLLLALVTAAGAALQLAGGRHPATTVPGIVITAISLSFMFYLYRAKLAAARALDSAAVAGDAACSLACLKLSGVVFAGSLAYWIRPALWWADAAAALALAFLIAAEGRGMLAAAARADFSGGCC